MQHDQRNLISHPSIGQCGSEYPTFFSLVLLGLSHTHSTGFLNTLGAYCTERLIPAAALIKLPETIAFETAAAMTMRGLTSAYLLRRLYAFKPGDSVLLHAAAAA